MLSTFESFLIFKHAFRLGEHAFIIYRFYSLYKTEFNVPLFPRGAHIAYLGAQLERRRGVRSEGGRM